LTGSHERKRYTKTRSERSARRPAPLTPHCVMCGVSFSLSATSLSASWSPDPAWRARARPCRDGVGGARRRPAARREPRRIGLRGVAGVRSRGDAALLVALKSWSATRGWRPRSCTCGGRTTRVRWRLCAGFRGAEPVTSCFRRVRRR